MFERTKYDFGEDYLIILIHLRHYYTIMLQIGRDRQIERNVLIIDLPHHMDGGG